jgi:hypothetical protein
MVTVIESPNCANVPRFPVKRAWTRRIGATHAGWVAGDDAGAGESAPIAASGHRANISVAARKWAGCIDPDESIGRMVHHLVLPEPL